MGIVTNGVQGYEKNILTNFNSPNECDYAIKNDSKTI